MNPTCISSSLPSGHMEGLCFLFPYGWVGDIGDVSGNHDLNVPNGGYYINLSPELMETPANPCLKCIVFKKQIYCTKLPLLYTHHLHTLISSQNALVQSRHTVMSLPISLTLPLALPTSIRKRASVTHLVPILTLK